MNKYVAGLKNLFVRAPSAAPSVVKVEAKRDSVQALRELFARGFAARGIVTPRPRFANLHARKAGPGRRHGHGVKS